MSSCSLFKAFEFALLLLDRFGISDDAALSDTSETIDDHAVEECAHERTFSITFVVVSLFEKWNALLRYPLRDGDAVVLCVGCEFFDVARVLLGKEGVTRFVITLLAILNCFSNDDRSSTLSTSFNLRDLSQVSDF